MQRMKNATEKALDAHRRLEDAAVQFGDKIDDLTGSHRVQLTEFGGEEDSLVTSMEAVITNGKRSA